MLENPTTPDDVIAEFTCCREKAKLCPSVRILRSGVVEIIDDHGGKVRLDSFEQAYTLGDFLCEHIDRLLPPAFREAL